jgi:periplasmic divalent cation tolerance protein
MKQGKILVLMTASSEEEAEKVARALLKERLIACANLIPRIRSLYHWSGQLCDDRETLILCKTQQHLFSRLAERVKTLHSYEVPEMIAISLADGWEPYFRWMEQETLSEAALDQTPQE